MTLKIEITKKQSFFFCGAVALSKKVTPSLELDLKTIDSTTAKGLLRGYQSGSINISEGLEELTAIAHPVKTETKTPVVLETLADVTVQEDKEEVAPVAKTSRTAKKANTEL
jgi:hypothetical protein